MGKSTKSNSSEKSFHTVCPSVKTTVDFSSMFILVNLIHLEKKKTKQENRITVCSHHLWHCCGCLHPELCPWGQRTACPVLSTMTLMPSAHNLPTGRPSIPSGPAGTTWRGQSVLTRVAPVTANDPALTCRQVLIKDTRSAHLWCIN